MDKSWLEPPEWWKRHKPLRWLLAFAILLFAYSRFDDWRDRRQQAAAPTVASSEPASAPAAVPPAAEPESPAPAAKAPPKPTPVAPAAKPAPVPAPPPDPMARYTAVESRRVNLMTLRSYESVSAVSAVLQQGGYKWEHFKQERRPRGNYPPYRVDTLDVAEYRHLGSSGKLRLEFFNDRLYESYFEPVKAGDYLYKLRKQTRLKRDSRGHVEHVQGNLRISSNIDLAESEVGKALRVKPFILWQDLRLLQQLKDWGPVH